MKAIIIFDRHRFRRPNPALDDPVANVGRALRFGAGTIRVRQVYEDHRGGFTMSALNSRKPVIVEFDSNASPQQIMSALHTALMNTGHQVAKIVNDQGETLVEDIHVSIHL